MNEISIIPTPMSVGLKDGVFKLDTQTRIVSSDDAVEVARIFAGWISESTGFSLPILAPADTVSDPIRFELIDALDTLGDEGYRLLVSNTGIHLQASTPTGLLYASQSLRQLLPPAIFSSQKTGFDGWEVPAVEITDWPRFNWRGAMLDVSRHFMPLDFIIKFIDLLALHKLNSFHWHLTDDQGWRIEIKKYPRLNEIGSWRDETMVGHFRGDEAAVPYDNTPHGGFYTQEQVKQVVAYAARLGINVVPEIEMPGHAQAAIASYPELGNTANPIGVSRGWGIHEHVFNAEESTFTFLQDVLDEVLALFPSKFIHIGGDEVPKNEWRESEQVQQRMEELDISTEDGLQSYFILRMDQFLTSRNRRLIGWDEILEGGLAPNATVMSWRGEAGGIAAVQAGHDVVMAPNTYTYFDYYQSEDRQNEPLAIGGNLPLEKVYHYEPIPSEVPSENAYHILGTQAQIWTEYIPDPAQVEYMAFPRLCALAEVAWSPKEVRNYQDFTNRLQYHLERLDHIPVNYRKP